jgi:hypothetical protein
MSVLTAQYESKEDFNILTNYISYDTYINIGLNDYIYQKYKNVYISIYDPASSTEPETECEGLFLSVPALSAKQFASEKLSTMYLEHLDFLNQVSTGEHPPIAPDTASQAITAWRQIWKASEYKMPVPAAATGPDGEMFYVWNAGRYHLELEIIPGRPAEFFYRDRETGEFWGEDYEVGEPLPAGIISMLPLFQ